MRFVGNPSADRRLETQLNRHRPEWSGLLGLDTVTLPAPIRVYGDPAADPIEQAIARRCCCGWLESW